MLEIHIDNETNLIHIHLIDQQNQYTGKFFLTPDDFVDFAIDREITPSKVINTLISVNTKDANFAVQKYVIQLIQTGYNFTESEREAITLDLKESLKLETSDLSHKAIMIIILKVLENQNVPIAIPYELAVRLEDNSNYSSLLELKLVEVFYTESNNQDIEATLDAILAELEQAADFYSGKLSLEDLFFKFRNIYPHISQPLKVKAFTVIVNKLLVTPYQGLDNHKFGGVFDILKMLMPVMSSEEIEDFRLRVLESLASTNRKSRAAALVSMRGFLSALTKEQLVMLCCADEGRFVERLLELIAIDRSQKFGEAKNVTWVLAAMGENIGEDVSDDMCSLSVRIVDCIQEKFSINAKTFGAAASIALLNWNVGWSWHADKKQQILNDIFQVVGFHYDGELLDFEDRLRITHLLHKKIYLGTNYANKLKKILIVDLDVTRYFPEDFSGVLSEIVSFDVDILDSQMEALVSTSYSQYTEKFPERGLPKLLVDRFKSLKPYISTNRLDVLIKELLSKKCDTEYLIAAESAALKSLSAQANIKQINTICDSVMDTFRYQVSLEKNSSDKSERAIKNCLSILVLYAEFLKNEYAAEISSYLREFVETYFIDGSPKHETDFYYAILRFANKMSDPDKQSILEKLISITSLLSGFYKQELFYAQMQVICKFASMLNQEVPNDLLMGIAGRLFYLIDKNMRPLKSALSLLNYNHFAQSCVNLDRKICQGRILAYDKAYMILLPHLNVEQIGEIITEASKLAESSRSYKDCVTSRRWFGLGEVDEPSHLHAENLLLTVAQYGYFEQVQEAVAGGNTRFEWMLEELAELNPELTYKGLASLPGFV